MEAGIKLAVFGVVALAFLIGGVSGFAGALTALVFLAVLVAVAGLAGFLILKSRLVARKKAGLLLIIAALLTAYGEPFTVAVVASLMVTAILGADRCGGAATGSITARP